MASGSLWGGGSNAVLAPELGSSGPDGMKARPFLSHLHEAYLNRPPLRCPVRAQGAQRPQRGCLAPLQWCRKEPPLRGASGEERPTGGGEQCPTAPLDARQSVSRAHACPPVPSTSRSCSEGSIHRPRSVLHPEEKNQKKNRILQIHTGTPSWI